MSTLPPATVEEYVDSYFADTPVLARIAHCESTLRHYGKNGTVIRGKKNPYDVGIMQINELYHGKTAKRLGIDLYSIEGNLAYARYLLEREGTAPWLSSVKCWGEENHIAKK